MCSFSNSHLFPHLKVKKTPQDNRSHCPEDLQTHMLGRVSDVFPTIITKKKNIHNSFLGHSRCLCVLLDTVLASILSI